MNPKTSPKHRAEPNEATLEELRVGENMKSLHGVAVVKPVNGKHRAPSIMAAPEIEEDGEFESEAEAA